MSKRPGFLNLGSQVQFLLGVLKIRVFSVIDALKTLIYWCFFDSCSTFVAPRNQLIANFIRKISKIFVYFFRKTWYN